MALSGDEILMTETGSLGPIDAQMKIGRSVISAYDYIEWIDEKRKEAEKNKALNPFDATMIAQISPGELGSVLHALNFAKDLVIDWLSHYKFKNWTVTESQQRIVTPEMKTERAKEIAEELTNHSKWRSHGRSIKIEDLENIGLKITNIENDKKLADIVYRIQTVCRLLFETTTSFKVFATQDNKIFRQAVPMGKPVQIPQMKLPDVVNIEQKCPKCGLTHKIYAKLVKSPKIDKDFQNKGYKPFPENAIIKCDCGLEIDLSGIKNQIELDMNRKIVFNSDKGEKK
jgi:hypothetical protein